MFGYLFFFIIIDPYYVQLVFMNVKLFSLILLF